MTGGETKVARIELPNAESTAELGARMARACRPGTVILLRGPLGAGKTTFVNGFVSALGGGLATSPSFVLAHSYPGGSMSVWHLDFFRLERDDVDALDLEQYLSPAAVTLIEWPERATADWPADRIEIDFQVQGNVRIVNIIAVGGGVEAAAGA